MVISIYNHKGGTGKTTTTVNLGRIIKDQGHSVLLIDLDPQANLTYSLGVHKTDVHSVYLSPDHVVETEEGLHILPNYTAPKFMVDYEFPSETALRDELETYFTNYDFVLIDCPPAMNLTVVNALLASDGIVLPALLDVLSLEALNQVIAAIKELLKEHKHSLKFSVVLPVMVDSRRLLTNEVKKYIETSFETPIFENYIRMNVKLAEAPSHGKSVVAYAPSSNGASDYEKVAIELLEYIKGL
ncbi:MAG: ParA family protein [Cyclobacteriaceae bacterium]|nr:ParA family protein [Cyclobacteriaceae bacterium]